jgi:hypothetical protein
MIENIQKYVRNSIIILHVNESFSDFDETIEYRYENVYVNPTRLNYIKYHSQLPIMISNFEFSEQFEYEYFTIFHTNQLFVKEGLEYYICDNDSSGYIIPNATNNVPRIILENTNILNHIAPNNVLETHVEGNFYKKNLFRKIIAHIKREMGNAIDCNLSVEEVLIPSLSYHYSDKNKIVTPYLKSLHFNNTSVSKENVYELFEKNKIALGYCNIPINTDTLFCLKPVERNMDDPIRKFIRELN